MLQTEFFLANLSMIIRNVGSDIGSGLPSVSNAFYTVASEIDNMAHLHRTNVEIDIMAGEHLLMLAVNAALRQLDRPVLNFSFSEALDSLPEKSEEIDEDFLTYLYPYLGEIKDSFELGLWVVEYTTTCQMITNNHYGRISVKAIAYPKPIPSLIADVSGHAKIIKHIKDLSLKKWGIKNVQRPPLHEAMAWAYAKEVEDDFFLFAGDVEKRYYESLTSAIVGEGNGRSAVLIDHIDSKLAHSTLLDLADALFEEWTTDKDGSIVSPVGKLLKGNWSNAEFSASRLRVTSRTRRDPSRSGYLHPVFIGGKIIDFGIYRGLQ